MADGGTIFLDEVGSVSQKMQVELLRVIETKQFSRVGGNQIITSDFRVITATNEPLEDLVKAGKFREDLYYRLNVFSIIVPPLRERREDIPLLAHFFLNRFSTTMNKPINSISKEAMDFLVKYDWHGNVKSLRTQLKGQLLSVKTIPLKLKICLFMFHQIILKMMLMGKVFLRLKRNNIFKVLCENNWNISRSAHILEIDRVTLYNKIKLGVDAPNLAEAGCVHQHERPQWMLHDTDGRSGNGAGSGKLSSVEPVEEGGLSAVDRADDDEP